MTTSPGLRWRVVLGLGGALALLGGVAVFAVRFLDGAPAQVAAGAVASTAAAERAAAATLEAGSADASSGSPRPGDALLAASRDVQPIDPLASPGRSTIAELERSGRAAFFGLVRGFDGEPCAGATIFHDGLRVGTSDELGRYRVEVAQNTWNLMSMTLAGHVLAAVKDGVGSGMTSCDGVSRQIDLELTWRGVLAGHCVERRSGRPVPHARLELANSRADGALDFFRLATEADATGAFRFVGAPPRLVTLRAAAERFESDGWFPFDLSSGADRTGIRFQLDPIVRARGWFAPWPPPSSPSGAAKVVAILAGVGSGPRLDPIMVDVAADGRFELAFASCGGIDVVLEVGGGAMWTGTVPSGLEMREIDFGRIELAAPASLVGVVALPGELLALGFELTVVAYTADASREYRFPIEADGRFHATPLPPGRATWSVMLGNEHLRGRFGNDAELEAGRELDLGRLELRDGLIAGEVARAGGARAPGAHVQFPIFRGNQFLQLSATCDALGRYAIAIMTDRWDDDARRHVGSTPLVPHGRLRDLVAHGEPTLVPFEGAVRCDLDLAPGLVLRGRVVDDRGEPVSKAMVDVTPDFEQGERAFWLHGAVKTDESGEFELDGLEDSIYIVRIETGDASLELGRVRPSDAPVTLRSPRSE